MPRRLGISDIRTDGSTQPRISMLASTIAEYAESMQEGAAFPAVTVFFDGADNWLADGFHRIEAAKKIGMIEISADVQNGTMRDAILYSVGANDTHGMRRTNGDKRRSVMTLLNDEEWAAWSDNEIARRCAVSQPFVSSLRPVTNNGYKSAPTERTFTTKHGTTSTMNTENIGRKNQPNIVDDEPGGFWENDEVESEANSISDAPTRAIIDFIDIKLRRIMAPEVKHEVVNNVLKHMRDLSVELNRL